MLTREEILDLQPGCELDCMIAYYVFGWRISSASFNRKRPEEGYQIERLAEPLKSDAGGGCSIPDGLAPVFSKARLFQGGANIHETKWCTRMGPAWLVWEACLTRIGPDAWARALQPAVRLRNCEFNTVSTLAIMVVHLTPLAICRAALLALLESATPTQETTQN